MEFSLDKLQQQLPMDEKSGAYLKNVKGVRVGAGNEALNIKSPDGFWLGSDRFDDAPFKVDFEGNLTSGGTIQGATIKNSAGTTLIDSTGLNSSNNFKANAISGTGPITTTSNSFVDVSGSTMTSFVLTRPAVVVLSFSVYGCNTRYEDTAGLEMDYMYAQLVDSVDGVVEVAFLTGIPLVYLDSFLYPAATVIMASYYSSTRAPLLSAGTHTLKLQFKRSNGTGTARIDAFGITYSILGI